MKKKTTMKAIESNWKKVFRVGYCDLQRIFRYDEPSYYNCGVYGWNCDIYVDYARDIAITTGYRNMRGERIPRELFKKYDDIARELEKDIWNKPFEEIKKAFENNKENFLNELYNL